MKQIQIYFYCHIIPRVMLTNSHISVSKFYGVDSSCFHRELSLEWWHIFISQVYTTKLSHSPSRLTNYQEATQVATLTKENHKGNNLLKFFLRQGNYRWHLRPWFCSRTRRTARRQLRRGLNPSRAGCTYCVASLEWKRVVGLRFCLKQNPATKATTCLYFYMHVK